MTTLETLKAARAKIADRKHWTQGVYARNSGSRKVTVDSPQACRWCALGALRAVGGRPIAAAEELGRICGSVIIFNDSHTHAEVLAIFDKAIALLETKEAA